MGLFSKISGSSSGSSSSSRPWGHGRTAKLLFFLGAAGSTLANALKEKVPNETRQNAFVVSEAVQAQMRTILDAADAARVRKAANLEPVDILHCDSPDLEHADPLRVEFEILELRDKFGSIPSLIRNKGYLPIKKILSWLGHPTGGAGARFTDEELLCVVEAWCDKQREHIAKGPKRKRKWDDFCGKPSDAKDPEDTGSLR